MSEMFLIIGATLGLFLTVIYGLFTLTLRKKRDKQPVKSRAPRLLEVSLIGNLLSVLSICGLIAFTDPEHIEDLSYSRFGIVASEVVFAPLMFSAYIARYFNSRKCSAVQLSKVYTISSSRESLLSTSSEQAKSYQQSTYIKVKLLSHEIIVDNRICGHICIMRWLLCDLLYLEQR